MSFVRIFSFMLWLLTVKFASSQQHVLDLHVVFVTIVRGIFLPFLFLGIEKVLATKV
jgi:hypothetical protein